MSIARRFLSGFTWSGTVTYRELLDSFGPQRLFPVRAYAVGTNLDLHTWGFQWSSNGLQTGSAGMRFGTFPEYYRSSNNIWEAVAPGEVPDETGLKTVAFPYGIRENSSPTSRPKTRGVVGKHPVPRPGLTRSRSMTGVWSPITGIVLWISQRCKTPT